MARGHVETYHHGRKWHNRIEGVEKPFSDHFTSGDARLRGREEASRLKVDHLVRSINGRVAEYTRYADDWADADAPVELVELVEPDQPVESPPLAPGPPRPVLPVRVRPTEVPPISRPRQSFDPRVNDVLREVNEEMRGMPTGTILWALVHRMPPSLRDTGPSMHQLAVCAAAIHHGTFRD